MRKICFALGYVFGMVFVAPPVFIKTLFREGVLPIVALIRLRLAERRLYRIAMGILKKMPPGFLAKKTEHKDGQISVIE